MQKFRNDYYHGKTDDYLMLAGWCQSNIFLRQFESIGNPWPMWLRDFLKKQYLLLIPLVWLGREKIFDFGIKK
jgi:hypothetical protein